MPLPYKISVDEASVGIISFLVEEVDKKATKFENYDVAKCKLTMDLKKNFVMRKKNKIMKKLKEQFGEEVEGDEE